MVFTHRQGVCSRQHSPAPLLSCHLRLDLRRFDDHMLADIGLSRADAEAELEKPTCAPNFPRFS